MASCMVLLCFSKDCGVRLKVFYLFFVFVMYYLCEKRYELSQYSTTYYRVRWVSRLTVLDLQTHSENRTRLYVGNLLYRASPVALTREGNGNPLQYSCLENPMDGGAWWATVHGSQRVGHDWATSLSLPGGSDDKESVCNVGDPALIFGLEDHLENRMATHSSILA